jgi:hypothetical protein
MKTSTTIVGMCVLGALLLSASCSGRYGDYCDKLIDCEGGNDKDRSACVEFAKAEADVADDYDCGDAFDTAFDCLVNSSVCTAERKLDDKACDDQRKAERACIEAASSKHDNPTPPANASSGNPGNGK